MEDIPEPLSAERQAAEKSTDESRARKRALLKVRRRGEFVVLVLRVAVMIVSIFGEALKLYQSLKSLIR